MPKVLEICHCKYWDIVDNLSLMIKYDCNSKLISSDDLDPELQINISQVNKLVTSLIAESSANFTPQPSNESTVMIKKLFEAGIQQAKKQKVFEGLRNIELSLQMHEKSRKPWEAFGFQLQELQTLLRNKIDLELVSEKYMDSFEDLEMLLGCGMAIPEVFMRMTDSLLKLKRFEEARQACEKGLSLDPNNTRLKVMHMECIRELVEYNGDI